jgi:hypothetical protein
MHRLRRRPRDREALAGGLLVLSGLMAGCFEADPAVFVEAEIDDASANVMSSTLVAALSGSFTLNLHLGPLADDAAEVKLNAVSLTNSDRTVTFVDAVGALPSAPFPVTVPVDGDVSVVFTVSADENELEVAKGTELCAAGGLTYVVVLDDSLRGGTIVPVSDAVMPSGCP